MTKRRQSRQRSFSLDKSEVIDVIEMLSTARSLNDVFIVLESHMRHMGIERMRFYRFERESRSKEGFLYSAGEHGHDSNRVSESIILSSSGASEKNFLLEESDKFWCKELRQPVVIVVDEDVTPPLKVYAKGEGPPHVKVPSDECADQPFAEDKSLIWIDFPLFVGDQFIGKITTDYGPIGKIKNRSKNRRSKKLVAEIEKLLSSHTFRHDCLRLYNTLRVAAPHLEYWETQQQRNRLNELSNILSKCRSPKEVLDECVSALPSERMFNCANADILTFHQDSLGRKRLILRATTVPHLQTVCDSVNYDLQDSAYALTEWAFETNTSLRLVDLLNPESRAAQLAEYQQASPADKIEWRESIPLSFRHESLMIVPFGTPDDEFAGVLRLADRLDDGTSSSFSELDQSLAETAVAQHIVPALRASNAVFCYQALETQLGALDAIANNRRHETLAELSKGIGKIFIDLVPPELRGEGRLKRLLLSHVDDNRSPQSFTLLPLPSSESELDIPEDAFARSFPLEKTLTGHVLNSEEPVHLTDLAHAQSTGVYLPIVDHARSVISTQIEFRGARFGTISILSSHYDLSTVPTFPLVLRTLARQAARILVQDRIQAVNAILSGVRHDLNPIVSKINELVHSPAEKFSHETFGLLISSLSQLLDSHCRSGPLPVGVFERNLYDVDIGDTIDSVMGCVKIMYSREFQARKFTTSGLDDRKIVARVYRPFLVATLLNVLSNAFSHSKSGTTVEASVSLKDGFVLFSVTNEISQTANVAAITRVMNLSIDNTLDNPMDEVSPFNRGVLNARRFAKLHRVRHGDQQVDGEVRHVYDQNTRKITVSVSIPEHREQ